MNNISSKMSKIMIALIILLILIVFFVFFLKISNAIWEDTEKMPINLSFIGSISTKEPIIMVETIDRNQNILEIITDGVFQDGFDSWSKKGKVTIIAENADKNYLQIGEAYSTNLISENCIFQDVLFNEGFTNLLFEYDFFTEDNLFGFDGVAFAVLIDNQLVHLEPVNQNTIGLRRSLVNVNFQKTETHQLKICAGNLGDRFQSSWINLYKVSSKVAVLNPFSSLIIKKYGKNICIKYEIDDEILETCSENQLSTTFSQPVLDNNVKIQLENVLFDLPLFVYPQHPPIMQDATICALDDRQLALYYPRISGLQQNFRLKYSYDSSVDWENATATKPVFSDLSLELQRASCINDRCINFFETLDQHSIQLEENLVVLVKQCDYSGQCSDVFFPEITQSCEELIIQNDISSVVINEIMFNPEGDDNLSEYEGEWVELFNPNPFSIDLTGYSIKDAAGWQVFLNQENCDNNSGSSDGGEIIINPNDYLVVFMNRAILNNSGDLVYLYNNQAQLMDQITYPGYYQENVTYSRFPDGADSWVNSFSSTPLGPNSFN